MRYRVTIAFLCFGLGLVASDLCSSWARQTLQARCSKRSLYKKYCPQQALKCKLFDDPKDGAALASPVKGDPPKKDPPKKATPKKDPPKKDPPKKKKLTANENFKQCCRANKVSDDCIALCDYNVGLTELADVFCKKPKAKCESHLKLAVYCGQNAENHTPCCKGKKVPEACNIFCNGAKQFPKLSVIFDGLEALKYAQCLEVYNDIYRCGESEYKGKKAWKTKSWEREQFPELIADYVAAQCKDLPGA